MRIAAIAIATLAVAGCGNETLLRITVAATGTTPRPASLRVTLVGDGITAPPHVVAPVSLPGTAVVRGVPSGTVCVEVEALDGAGSAFASAVTTVSVAAHRTNHAYLFLAATPQSCAPPIADLSTAALDLSTPPDLGAVAVCPAGALFCDDFESDNLTRWSYAAIKHADMGAIARTAARAAHGRFSVEATGGGTPANDNYVAIVKQLTPVMPPLAMRANVWTAAPLDSYTMVMTVFDATTHGFAVGGDDRGTWVVTEDQAGAPDERSDMVPAGGGGWHCLELVVDGGGKVTLFVDGHQIVGPWLRATATSYVYFGVGIGRTTLPSTDVLVDDVAIGPTRLYCP